MNIKEINQNPERYTTDGKNWKISASKDVKPIYLPIGVTIENLKPVIKANGVIVKVGDNHLCSLTTLDSIKESKNPHYDIVQNGSIKVKDKEVIMGKTIKIIELDISKLQGLADSRDLMNRQSGVINVEYTNEGKELIEGIPQKLIDQINYTLDKGSNRPKDKFEVVDYFKMVDIEANPHYTFIPVRVETDQGKTIFDPKRLQTFLIEVDDQLKLLRRDFNTIQDTFYDGTIPTPNIYGIIQEDILAEIDTDDTGSLNSKRRTEISTIIDVEPTPTQLVADDTQLTNQPPIVPPVTQPPVERWRLRKRRDGQVNGMGIYPTANIKNFNVALSHKADKKQGTIREGQSFTGYKFKFFDIGDGLTIWALQDEGTTTIKAYAYQGRRDIVDKI
jgi:hypothetical protein